MTTKGRAVEFGFGLACLLLGAWVWVYSGTFPQLQQGYPGPSLFPRLIAAGLVLSGLYLATMVWLRQGEEAEGEAVEVSRAGLVRFALILGIVAAYPPLRAWLGFVPTVALLIFAVTLSLRARLSHAVLTAVLVSLAIHYAFTSLLRVPL
jgi:putative tricarboxylic transport membrane protein